MLRNTTSGLIAESTNSSRLTYQTLSTSTVSLHWTSLRTRKSTIDANTSTSPTISSEHSLKMARLHYYMSLARKISRIFAPKVLPDRFTNTCVRKSSVQSKKGCWKSRGDSVGYAILFSFVFSLLLIGFMRCAYTVRICHFSLCFTSFWFCYTRL